MSLWYSTLKETVQSHPLTSNVMFSFLMVILEKLVDMEFVCPCKMRCENALFVFAFFILPAILAFLMMINLKNDNIAWNETWYKKVLGKGDCVIPAVAWIIILLFDGRYIACGMTYWPGRYETANKASSIDWCEPHNGTLYEERLMASQEWYFHSQCGGLALTLLVVLVGSCITIRNFCANEETSGQTDTGNETVTSGHQIRSEK